MADFEAWLVFLILVVNVVGELQRKRTLAASRGFLAAARLSCCDKLMLIDAFCSKIACFPPTLPCLMPPNEGTPCDRAYYQRTRRPIHS